ncbi:MAG: hypothetical protein EA385_10660 [Salinarimonadaceae bacterium]|nr:MAG: hypothetical protein EA385_10660 [Salinarimonadaceae bacterium]
MFGQAFSGRPGRLASMAQATAANNARTESLRELNEGLAGTTALYNDANQFMQPFQQGGQQGFQTYLGSLGLGGDEGRQQAVNAFQTGPGFQFAMDQGQQAGLRAASAGGMLNSGNTQMALTRFGQGLANQAYGGWQDRLAGLGQMGMQAGDAMGANRMRLGDIGMGVAQQRAGIQSDTEQQLGAARAGGIMSGQQAAQNRFGAVMGGVNTLAGLVGQRMGAGGSGFFGGN